MRILSVVTAAEFSVRTVCLRDLFYRLDDIQPVVTVFLKSTVEVTHLEGSAHLSENTWVVATAPRFVGSNRNRLISQFFLDIAQLGWEVRGSLSKNQINQTPVDGSKEGLFDSPQIR